MAEPGPSVEAQRSETHLLGDQAASPHWVNWAKLESCWLFTGINLSVYLPLCALLNTHTAKGATPVARRAAGTSKRSHWSALGAWNGCGFHEPKFVSSVSNRRMDNSRTTVGQQSDNRGLRFRHAEMQPALTAARKQAADFNNAANRHQSSAGAHSHAAKLGSVGPTNFSRFYERKTAKTSPNKRMRSLERLEQTEFRNITCGNARNASVQPSSR